MSNTPFHACLLLRLPVMRWSVLLSMEVMVLGCGMVERRSPTGGNTMASSPAAIIFIIAFLFMSSPVSLAGNESDADSNAAREVVQTKVAAVIGEAWNAFATTSGS